MSFFRKLTNYTFYNLHQSSKRLKASPKIQSQPIPFIPMETFIDESYLTLTKLQKAFEQQKQYEDRITEIDFTENELIVKIQHLGEYRFLIDSTTKQLYWQSPFNGVFGYFWDNQLQQWVNNKDGHFLIENLTREIVKNCKGYLEL